MRKRQPRTRIHRRSVRIGCRIPQEPFQDKISRHLSQKCAEHLAEADYGLYRCTKQSQYKLIRDENRGEDSLDFLAEVIYYDLSGLGNSFRLDYLNAEFQSYFPYQESLARLAPGVVASLKEEAEQRGLAEADLRTVPEKRGNHKPAISRP